MLVNNNEIELPEPKRTVEVWHIKDPKYHYYHRIISYPTRDCSIQKDKILALVKARVLRLNEDMKKVATNMVSP